MSGKRDRMDQLTFPDIVDNRPLEETDVAGALLRGSPPPLYARRHGCLYTADCLDFLRRIRPEAAAFVFADPPFDPPSVWDRTVPSDRYLDWSLSWIKESARILSPAGCLCICGPGELLADLKRPALAHFAECRLLVWYYRNRSHAGKDWGESYQNLLLLYKGNSHPMHTDLVRIPYEKHTIRYYQDRPGGTSRWRPHPLGAKPKDVLEVPALFSGTTEKTAHPDQKPEALLRRLLLAYTGPDDLVVDPFSGSGTTLVAAEQLGRRWLGGDSNALWHDTAVQRLDHVPLRSVGEWIAYDRRRTETRESMR